MNSLFRANFTRLFKDKILWFTSGTVFLYAVIYMLNSCRQVKGSLAGYGHVLEDYYFQFATALGLLVAAFCALYLSVDYSDGVMRNKIIAGHKRREIYLSNLLAVFCASLFMMCMALLGGLVGIPTLGLWNMGGLFVLVCILILVMFLLAFCAVFTLISMLIQNKTVSTVVTILSFFALLLPASIMINRLAQPEMVSDTMLTIDGIVFSDPVPNPLYVQGILRQILDFAVDLFPAGQAMRLGMNEAAHPLRMLLCSVAVTVFVTLGGILLFERKDLK